MLLFSDAELSLAEQLHPLWGDRWQPAVGHYVLDVRSLVTKPSPFQERVYFVLNYDYFIDLVGGLETFKRSMVWLPTWEQCRCLVRDLDLPSVVLLEDPDFRSSFSAFQERECLYLFLLKHLSGD